jgi:hypothetical protein
MTPQKIIKQAKEELRGGGFMPGYEPTWHPYYWLGRLRAAEEVRKRDRLRRRNHK